MRKLPRPVVIAVILAAVLGMIAVGCRKRARAPGPKAVAVSEIDPETTVMRLLPPDVKTALWFDLERLQAARVTAPLFDAFWGGKLANVVERFSQATTVNFRIELNELLIAGDAAEPESLLIIGRGSFDTTIILAVLRQSERVDAEEYSGATIFRMPDPKNYFECLCVFGPNEIAAGTEKAVKEMLDYREAGKTGGESAGAIQQMLMSLDSNAVAKGATMQFAGLPKVQQKPFEKSVRAAAASASLAGLSEAILRVRLDLNDAKLAQQGREYLETALGKKRVEIRQRGSKRKSMVRFLDSVTMSRKDGALTVQATVNAEVIEKLVQSKTGAARDRTP